MSEAQTIKRMTPDEFYAWQADQDKNCELVDGFPLLPAKGLTGASLRHDDIAVRNPNGNLRRPGVIVNCRRMSDRAMEAGEPRLVVEVLSPSTMAFDRFRKVEKYKTNQAIRAVLLVASESPEVIVWRRRAEGWHSQIVESLAAIVTLPEIGCDLTLAEIYEDTGVKDLPNRMAE